MLKEFALEEIEHSLEEIEKGKPYFSARLKDLVDNEPLLNLDLLSNTEKRIIKQIAQIKSTREIGEEMFISHRTVENPGVTL